MLRFLFLLLFSFTAYATEDSDTYLVSGIAVNTSGKSPVLAKTAAHVTARRDAFLVLLTRLDLKPEMADKVTDDEISDMVRSEQIEKERITGNNYSATFNIMFAKNFVEHILSQKKSAVSMVNLAEGEGYLLIPVRLKKHQPIVWGEDNDWKKALANSLNKKSLKQFVIPDSDIANVAIFDGTNVGEVNYSTLEGMFNRYRVTNGYLLVFSYDEIENKVLIDVVRLSKLQKKQVKLSFVNVDRLGYETLINKVADKALDYLVGSQNQSAKNQNSSVIKIKIFVSNLSNWLMMKNKIETSNLVNQLNIEAIARDYVVINVNYVGDENLIAAFAKKGISLTQQSANNYVINAN